MIAIGLLFVRMLCDCFKSRRRLEAEILVLRHQLNVLQQRMPRRVHLRWADRAVFIWLYRRYPRMLDALTIVRPDDGYGVKNARTAAIEPDDQGTINPTQMQSTTRCALLQDIELMPHYQDFGFQPPA